MAGDWIKIEKATARKPEIIALAEELDVHPDHALGLVVRFWSWCDDHLSSCHVRSVTIRGLNLAIGHANFSEALVKVGWLQVRSSSLEVPHFDRHLSQSAKTRALSKERKAKERDSASREERDKCHADNVTKVRPEKRREEKRRDHTLSTDQGVEGVQGDGAPKSAGKPRPSLDEVKAFVVELGFPASDGEALWHGWEANGWKRGSNPIRDWRAAVRNWVASGWLPSQKLAQHRPQSQSYNERRAAMEFPHPDRPLPEL